MASKKESHSNGAPPSTASENSAEAPASTPEASGASTTAAGGAGNGSMAGTSSTVNLPKKLVAKEIVPRKALIYKKVPKLGPDGKALKDGDGNDLMEVENPEPRQLYRVFGTASSLKSGESTYGTYNEFGGDFEAIRFSDRARFVSSRLFLQDPAEGLLMAALARVQREDPSATVEFSFDVGVKPSQRWIDSNQGNSYEYVLASKMDVAQADPLKLARERAMADLPALPAPAST